MKQSLSGSSQFDDRFFHVLKDVCKNCKTCKLYAPTLPKPVVGHLADYEKMEFNDVVSLDLKEWNGERVGG